MSSGNNNNNPIYSEFMLKKIQTIEKQDPKIKHSDAYNQARHSWLEKMEEIKPWWCVNENHSIENLKDFLGYANLASGIRFNTGLSYIDADKPIVTMRQIKTRKGTKLRTEMIPRPERIVALVCYYQTPDKELPETEEVIFHYSLALFPAWHEEQAFRWFDYQQELARLMGSIQQGELQITEEMVIFEEQ
jgi:hypothetical protein